MIQTHYRLFLRQPASPRTGEKALYGLCILRRRGCLTAPINAKWYISDEAKDRFCIWLYDDQEVHQWNKPLVQAMVGAVIKMPLLYGHTTKPYYCKIGQGAKITSGLYCLSFPLWVSYRCYPPLQKDLWGKSESRDSFQSKRNLYMVFKEWDKEQMLLGLKQSCIFKQF